MALGGVRHGSVTNPSWLCDQSVMALWPIRHGSGMNQSPVETRFCFCRQYPTQTRTTSWSVLLYAPLYLEWLPLPIDKGSWRTVRVWKTDPWWTSLRAMTDSLQSHNGRFAEPSSRAIKDVSQNHMSYFMISITQKTKLKIRSQYLLTTKNI